MVCTTHSSSHQGDLPQCMLGYTSLGVSLETPWVLAWRPPGCGPGNLGVGLETPLGVGLETPWVWAWKPGCGPGDPPGCGPGDPLGVGLETPLARPLNFLPGCGPGNLQGMLGYRPPPRDLLQGMLGYHPLVNKNTDTCENITLPQLRCGR